VSGQLRLDDERVHDPKVESSRGAASPRPSGRAPLSLADPLLTADEAATILGGVPAKTVLQLAREGRLPSVRIGRHVRFVRAELEATLSERRAV
jgi:excisionase family DNA binding protein